MRIVPELKLNTGGGIVILSVRSREELYQNVEIIIKELTFFLKTVRRNDIEIDDKEFRKMSPFLSNYFHLDDLDNISNKIN